jgi:hypothetical protein
MVPAEQLQCVPDLGPPMVTQPAVEVNGSQDNLLRGMIRSALDTDIPSSDPPFHYVEDAPDTPSISVRVEAVNAQTGLTLKLRLLYEETAKDVTETLPYTLPLTNDDRAAVAQRVAQAVTQFAQTDVAARRTSVHRLAAACRSSTP